MGYGREKRGLEALTFIKVKSDILIDFTSMEASEAYKKASNTIVPKPNA